MSKDLQKEVYQQFRTSQDKYAYFLLAAAGAAIGFALTQTQGKPLSLTQLPLGIAVICWGLSFYYGCRFVEYITSSLYANFDLLKVQDGIHPDVGMNPELISAASEGIRDALKNNSKETHRLANLQFQLLISGAIMYIIWHVVEMYILTKP
jgi:hypothetical protein